MAGLTAPITFASSPRSSVGLEWEIALVDRDSRDLRQVAGTVLDAVRGSDGREHPGIRQELLLNTVELVSAPHATIRGAGADLVRYRDMVAEIVEPLRVDLMCAGTHPFAQWTNQRVTDKERYAKLIDRTQWWGRQMLIYGVHMHVGVEDRDKALPIVRALLAYVPHLEALSASSPYWAGQSTGYASNRALMFQQLPTAGLPCQFDHWSELEHYVHDMLHTGVIDDFTEIRWDIRPSPRFGTVEVRVCDGLPSLEEVLALGAFVQCLVEDFSTRLDKGEHLPTLPTWFAQENKWRAARYGMDAIIILNEAGDEELVTDALARLLPTLEPIAARLGCAEELGRLPAIVQAGASYQRQRAVAEACGGDLVAVVESLVGEMKAGRVT
ncbi:MAG: glutamate--cysteine ligase [Bifidobacteriaceae bacterium]|jgi:carboxylate-amine ligase|nr:glutamate--cysteine ligase [Bifidobacteriaceae bacterium]